MRKLTWKFDSKQNEDTYTHIGTQIPYKIQQKKAETGEIYNELQLEMRASIND